VVLTLPPTPLPKPNCRLSRAQKRLPDEAWRRDVWRPGSCSGCAAWFAKLFCLVREGGFVAYNPPIERDSQVR
jgi:hypothetical protein